MNRDSIEREKHRHQLTLEALADVGAGRVIDHREIQAWADSLSTQEPRLPPHARIRQRR